MLGLSVAEFKFIRWLDTRRLSYPGQPDRTCDTVAHLERLDDNQRPWAIVAEFNIDPDPLMFGRFLGYLGTLWIEEKPAPERGDRFHVGAIQVNLTGNGECSRNYDWPKTGMRSDFAIREWNLSSLVAGNVLETILAGSVPRIVLPWIPLMQGGSESSIIEKWKEVATAETSQQRRADYAGLALVFAEATKCRPVWLTALKEWNMIESIQVKEWQDMARQDNQRQTVLDVLKDKFGALPTDLPSHLEAIDDMSILRQLLLKAVRAGSLEDFQRQFPNGAK